MPAATSLSQTVRTRLDGPQIGEGIWSVFDAQTLCIQQFTTAQGDVNGFRFYTASAGNGPRFSVQGPAADINLILSGQGAGFVVIDSPLEITGPVTLDSTLHVVGAVTFDSTLHVLGAVTLDSTLRVSGATTLQAALTQSGGTASFDSPTLVVDETAHNVGIGTIPIAGGAKLDVTNGYLRALNGTNTPPTSGIGIELVTTSGIGFIAAVDRSGPANSELHIDAYPLKLNTTGGPVTIGGSVTQTGGTVSFDSPTLVVDEVNHRVGVGTAAPAAKLDVVGNVQLSGGILIFTAATSQIIPGTASFIITNHAQTQTNLLILDSGATTIQGGLTVTTGGITITAGDLRLANAQLVRGGDTWLLPTGLGTDTLVTLTATQTLTNKTLGVGLKILLVGDATGDMYYNGGAGTVTRLAVGPSTTVLVGGSSPGWAQVDRTRVVLTTATGIMTLHDAQTKDAAQIFQAQVVCGPSGTGTHALVCADSAPSGATFTSSQIGLYSATSVNLMLRQMNNAVETYWLANSSGVNFGALTNHSLTLYTQNSARITIAAGGNVSFGGTPTLYVDETNNYVALGSTFNPGAGHRLYIFGDIRWDGATFANPTGTVAPLQCGGTGGPGSKTVNAWVRLNLGGSLGYIPWFL